MLYFVSMPVFPSHAICSVLNYCVLLWHLALQELWQASLWNYTLTRFETYQLCCHSSYYTCIWCNLGVSCPLNHLLPLLLLTLIIVLLRWKPVKRHLIVSLLVILYIIFKDQRSKWTIKILISYALSVHFYTFITPRFMPLVEGQLHFIPPETNCPGVEVAF